MPIGVHLRSPRCVSEEILLRVREVKRGVRIIGILGDMRRLSGAAKLARRCELGADENARSSRTDHVETQQPRGGDAGSDRSTFQELFHCVPLAL
jgi:hypothetical protein